MRANISPIFIDKIDVVFYDIGEIEVAICDTANSNVLSCVLSVYSEVFGRVQTTQANATRLFLLPRIVASRLDN